MLIERTHYYKTFCQKNLHVNKMRGFYMKVLNFFGTSFPLISKWQAHDGKSLNRLLKSSGVAPGRCWSFESIGALHELAEVLLHKSDILEIRKLSALEEHRTLMLDKSPSYGVAKDPKFIADNDTHVRSNLVIVSCLYFIPMEADWPWEWSCIPRRGTCKPVNHSVRLIERKLCSQWREKGK